MRGMLLNPTVEKEPFTTGMTILVGQSLRFDYHLYFDSIDPSGMYRYVIDFTGPPGSKANWNSGRYCWVWDESAPPNDPHVFDGRTGVPKGLIVKCGTDYQMIPTLAGEYYLRPKIKKGVGGDVGENVAFPDAWALEFEVEE